MLYYGSSYRILLFKHKWKHHYSKHFCKSYTGLHFIESQIKSVDASNIPSALNLYLWGLAWCSSQWVRKKHTKRKARQMKILPKKNYRELRRSSLPFRFHFIDLLYDTQNNIRERHPEKRRRIYKSIKVLVSHNDPRERYSLKEATTDQRLFVCAYKWMRNTKSNMAVALHRIRFFYKLRPFNLTESLIRYGKGILMKEETFCLLFILWRINLM